MEGMGGRRSRGESPHTKHMTHIAVPHSCDPTTSVTETHVLRNTSDERLKAPRVRGPRAPRVRGPRAPRKRKALEDTEGPEVCKRPKRPPSQLTLSKRLLPPTKDLPRLFQENKHWRCLQTGTLADGIRHLEQPDTDQPCYIGEFPPGALKRNTDHGTNCRSYAEMHVWICDSLESMDVHPLPVLLGVGAGTGPEPGCNRFRFWWHSHAVLVTNQELTDRQMFPYASQSDIWALLKRSFRTQTPGFRPGEHLPLAWRLNPALWDAKKQRMQVQRTSSSMRADEQHLNRIDSALHAASLAGVAVHNSVATDIRRLGIVPTGRTVQQITETRTGRLVTNASTELLTVMMNMWSTSAHRDPIGDYVTPRKARSAVMHGWNRWQILVMLRSFDPVPDEPVLVLDLFSGMGTGMLAATDTPKITGASHVIWVSVEKDDDVALLHYNSARAAITSQVFGERLQWLSYRDIETGGLRTDMRVKANAVTSAVDDELLCTLGHQTAWWLDRSAVRRLMRVAGVRARNVLVMNGSPCDDCSGNNPWRQGIKGSRSQLFRFVPIVYCNAKNDKVTNHEEPVAIQFT